MFDITPLIKKLWNELYLEKAYADIQVSIESKSYNTTHDYSINIM